MTKDKMPSGIKNPFDALKLVRRNIIEMKPYSSARDEFKGEAEVFLDANENPYPTPYNRYPDPLQWKVKEKLSAVKSVDPEHIFLGNGSDEAIDLLIRAFCEPNQDSIVTTDPTYGMYAVCAELNAVSLIKVPLAGDFDLDADAMLNAIQGNTKLIFLCSPNNPTGNLLSESKILRILENFNGIVVIDEAYIDFTQHDSFTTKLNEYSNLVVLQTFSKAWGLAGLRLGMAFADKAIINVLNKIKYPYNINTQTQDIALKALAEIEAKDKAVAEILEQRAALAASLEKLRITEAVYPSDANFLLIKVKNAPDTYQYLMNRKIIVRDRSKVTLCKDCLRITVGTPLENKNLIAALEKL